MENYFIKVTLNKSVFLPLFQGEGWGEESSAAQQNIQLRRTEPSSPRGRETYLVFYKPEELQRLMCFVTSNTIAALLAAAKVNGFGFRRFVLFGGKRTSLVATIAKRLSCTFAASAKPVAFASLNFYRVGGFLSDMRFVLGHVFSFDWLHFPIKAKEFGKLAFILQQISAAPSFLIVQAWHSYKESGCNVRVIVKLDKV